MLVKRKKVQGLRYHVSNSACTQCLTSVCRLSGRTLAPYIHWRRPQCVPQCGNWLRSWPSPISKASHTATSSQRMCCCKTMATCDFGISKDIISCAYESTMNLSAAGTLAYCAPEAGKSWLLQSCNFVYTSCVQRHLYTYTSGVYE